MRFSKGFYLPITVVALLCGCGGGGGSSSSTSHPAAPLPTGSTTGTVTTATAPVTLAAAGTTITIPTTTTAALLTLSGGNPVTVAFSQNAPNPPTSGVTALGTVPSGSVATATWVINAAVATPSIVTEGIGTSSAVGANPQATLTAQAWTFQISVAGGLSRTYTAIASYNGGAWDHSVTVAVVGQIATVSGTATDVLPILVMVRETWSSTGGN